MQKLDYALSAFFFVVVFLGTLLAQLEISRLFWEAIPLTRFIQFPWRLLGVASFCTAILGGFIIYVLQMRIGNPGAWLVTIILTAAVTILSTYHLDPNKSRLWTNLSDDDLGIIELFERGRFNFPLFSDYSPRDMQVSSGELAVTSRFADPQLPTLENAPHIQIEHFSPYRINLQYANDAPLPLRVHRIFFPGWQVYVNGKAVDTSHSGPVGLVTAEIPPGNHAVEIRFGPTPVRYVANLWSALTLVILGALYVVSNRSRNQVQSSIRKRTVAAAGVLIMLSALGYVYSASYPGTKAVPTPIQADFDQSLQLLGYRLQTETWRPGETVQLNLYWLNQRQLPDLKVFLHLVLPDDMERVAQLDSEPVLGYSPMSHWMPGELVDDRYHLVLNKDIPPGDYLLLMGVYHPETVQNLPIYTDAHVFPGERLVLHQIRVGE